MTEKRAIEMTETELAELLASIKRGPPPAPISTDRQAKDMTEAEREAFIRECIKRAR